MSLTPTKLRMATKLYLRWWNLLSIFAKKKYMDLRPNMAKMLELKTKNGSEVMAKMAGTLSKANKISVNSMTTNAIKSGVAAVICFILIKNFCPCIWEVIGITFRKFL